MEKSIQIDLFQSRLEISDEIIRILESIDEKYFPYPWKNGELSNFLELNSFVIVVLKSIEGVIGFTLWGINSADSFAHLLKIVIADSARGQGHGSELLNHSISKLKNLGFTQFYLEVAVDNQSAISLYCKNQFEIIHTKKSYYSDGADALIMTRRVGT